MRIAPSLSECAVWTRRWIKGGAEDSAAEEDMDSGFGDSGFGDSEVRDSGARDFGVTGERCPISYSARSYLSILFIWPTPTLGDWGACSQSAPSQHPYLLHPDYAPSSGSKVNATPLMQ